MTAVDARSPLAGTAARASALAAGSGGVGGFQVSYEFEGAEAIRNGFERWADAIQDWHPVLEAQIQLLERHEQIAFAAEGSTTGPRWAPLSPKYARAKARHYPGRGILERTYALRESLTQGRGPGAVREVGDRVAIFGTTVDYAAYHQLGDGVPRRPEIRYSNDASLVGEKHAEDGEQGSLAWGLGQIAQAYVVEQRRRTLGTSVESTGAIEDTARFQATLANLMERELR